MDLELGLGLEIEQPMELRLGLQFGLRMGLVWRYLC